MPWDIDSKEGLNPARRFNWDEEGNEWVEVILASDSDVRNCFKKAGIKEKVFLETDRKTRQMQRFREFAPTDEERDRFDEELWDFTIARWYLVKPDGSEITCTRENKILMMRGSIKFSNWINDSLDIMREDIKVYKQELEKN